MAQTPHSTVSRGGTTALLIDNLRRPLVSANLATAITATYWEDRVLGTSEMTRVPVRCAFIATGNNPTLSSEIARRTVRIRLDAKVDRPWLREQFRHTNLRRWGRQSSRMGVLGGTDARSGLDQGGEPEPQNTPTLGMFESQVLSGVLHVAEIRGFLGNLDEFYQSADTEGEMIGAFLTGWWQKFASDVVGVSDLYEIATTDGSELDLGAKGDRSQRIRLGKILTDLRDRRYKLDDKVTVQIVKAGTEKRAQQWKLERG